MVKQLGQKTCCTAFGCLGHLATKTWLRLVCTCVVNPEVVLHQLVASPKLLMQFNKQKPLFILCIHFTNGSVLLLLEAHLPYPCPTPDLQRICGVGIALTDCLTTPQPGFSDTTSFFFSGGGGGGRGVKVYAS